MPTLDPSEAGFTNTGQPSACPTRPGQRRVVRIVSAVAQRQRRGDDDPGPAQHVLAEVLVHRDRRPEDAGADVRQPDRLEQALHRAVLAERPVQRREHHVDPRERRRPAVDLRRERSRCPAGGPPGASTRRRRERRARRCCRAAARSRPRRSRPEAPRSARDRARPRPTGPTRTRSRAPTSARPRARRRAADRSRGLDGGVTAVSSSSCPSSSCPSSAPCSCRRG